MARLTNVYRVEDMSYINIGRRQLPLIAGDNLMMLMDLNSKGLVIDCPLIRGKDLEEFTRKYNLLSDEELKQSLEVENLEFLSVLSQCVQCVGCRRSVERLFYQLTLSGHNTLDPIVIENTGVLSIADEKIKSPQALCTLLYKHNDILNNLLETQIKTKKSSRCSLHSLDTFRSRPFSETWREVWGCMKHRCREEIVVIETKELHDSLDNYLKKHKFCQECRTKVEKAYTLLVSDSNSNKEKGFVPSLYSNIRKCLAEKHVHITTKADFIDGLIRKAEPEINGNFSKQRERHAKTLEIAQEEVLTCVGMVLYERLKRIYISLREEERACQVLAAVGVHALCRSFDMFVEKKQGISNLELLYKEISKAEKAKEHKKEQKKLKKKKKKIMKKNTFTTCNENDDEASEVETSFKDEELSSIHCPCGSDGEICTKSIDGGYGSEQSSHMNSRTSSVGCSPEGSEVSCYDGLCNHDHHAHAENYSSSNGGGGCGGISSNNNKCPCENNVYVQHPSTTNTLSLQQMLDDFDELEKEDNLCIPDEVVLEFKCREGKIKQLRQELREHLKQNFAQMCMKSKMAQENCKISN